MAIRAGKLGIELVSLLRALENIVSHVDSLVGVSVEEASGSLGGGILRKVKVIVGLYVFFIFRVVENDFLGDFL